MHCIAAWHLSYVLVQFEERSSFLSGHYHDAIIENMIMEVFEIDFRPHTCGRGQVGYHYSEQSSDILHFAAAHGGHGCVKGLLVSMQSVTFPCAGYPDIKAHNES